MFHAQLVALVLLTKKQVPEGTLQRGGRRNFGNGLDAGVLADVALQVVGLLVHQVVPKSFWWLGLYRKEILAT